MQLFKATKKEALPPVKIAGCATRLSDNTENWPEEIQKHTIEHIPSVANAALFVQIDDRDEVRGDANGRISVDGTFTIPFSIEDFILSPLDVLVYRGKAFATTRRKILELLLKQDPFERLATKSDMANTSSGWPSSMDELQ